MLLEECFFLLSVVSLMFVSGSVALSAGLLLQNLSLFFSPYWGVCIYGALANTLWISLRAPLL
jgi:hypothetical protein